LGDGRKWTFFITQSTSLARRQAEILINHLPWNTALFNNEMNIKHWVKKDWNNVLEHFHVSTINLYLYYLYVLVYTYIFFNYRLCLDIMY